LPTIVRTDRAQTIFFVDDEAAIRKVVGETLDEVGFLVSCFGSAKDCLKALKSQDCDLLIADVKMPAMDGIELLRRAKRLVPWLPVLIITGYGDIPLAVEAMRAGAEDFIEKPLDKKDFLRRVIRTLQKKGVSDSYRGKSLSEAEMKVLKYVAEGKSSKETAELLGRSVRTIEVHRSHIKRKLGVENLVDLVKRASVMGLVNFPPSTGKRRKR
jgi:two-component system response regulator FixJ